MLRSQKLRVEMGEIRDHQIFTMAVLLEIVLLLLLQILAW